MQLKIIAVCLCLFLSSTAYATTYYSSTGGSGSTCSVGSPCSISSGIAKMSASGGDTLIVNDGTYGVGLSGLTSGTSGAYNIVKAANDGLAIFTSLTIEETKQYLQVEGFRFNQTGSGESQMYGQYQKILRCSFNGGPYTGNSVQVAIGCNPDYTYHASDTLMEDCLFYGLGGRYNLLAYNADNVVFRRCVVRHDGAWGEDGAQNNPESGIMLYNSKHVEVQNCIVIDSNLAASSSPCSSGHGPNCTGYAYWDQAYYCGCNTSSPATIYKNEYISYRGNIALNGNSSGFRLDGSCDVTIDNFVDNIVYDVGRNTTTQGGLIDGSSNHTSIISGATHNTFGNSTISTYTYNSSLQSFVLGAWSSGSKTITNSLMWKWDTDNINGFTNSYADRYNINNLGSCSNCVTTNPTLTANLKYLPRLETGSSLLTAGQAGTRMGAEVLKKIGVSGTLYGETGYNTTTTDNLWPWPYEDRIKSEMSGVATVGNRGFTTYSGLDGVHNTLTSYVWEYLGNQIPSDVYGGGSDTTSPDTTISTSSPQSISSDSLAISGTASDAVGVSGVKWRIGAEPDATHGTVCTGTTSWSATVTGFSSGANTLYIEAYDAAGNYDFGNSITVNYSIPSSAMLSGATMSGGRIN
jgi:hypothetical protein